MPRRKVTQAEAVEPDSAPEITPEFAEAVVNGIPDERDEAHDAETTDVESLLNGKDAETDEATDPETIQYVKYVGRATERQIDSGTWPPGVDQGLSAVWGFSNNFKIPATSFSKSQLDYLLGDEENGFKLVDGARPQV